MTLPTLFFIAIGLSMDAFAVALCKGLALRRVALGDMAVVGLWFGAFQAAMPLLGYLLGTQFAARIMAFDHWVVFLLLGLIGGRMIAESRSGAQEEADAAKARLGPREMLPAAVATSIDALAVGISFAFLGVRILPPVVIIGLSTLVLSMAGVKAGSMFGMRFKSRAELAGGIILIFMGAKILFEHLGLFGAP